MGLLLLIGGLELGLYKKELAVPGVPPEADIPAMPVVSRPWIKQLATNSEFDD